MIEINEIHRRLDNVERSVQQVTEICHTGMKVSPQLLNCVQELNRQTQETRQRLTAQGDNQLYESVDELEQLSDRAKNEIELGSDVDDQIRSAIMRAYDELSSLMLRLH